VTAQVTAFSFSQPEAAALKEYPRAPAICAAPGIICDLEMNRAAGIEGLAYL